MNTPVEVCETRDPKGLYKKAAAGDLPNLTGVGQMYEEPTSADVVVAGDGELGTAVESVVERALEDIGPRSIVQGDPLAGLGGEGI